MAAIPSPPLPPPSQPELFELSFDEELGGARPAPLLEVLPQEQVQRHTVDQIVDAVPGLPTLDVLVPQMVEEPMALLMAFHFFVPEQVIKVPKISTPSHRFFPCRRRRNSWWKLRRSCLSLRLSGSLSSRPLVVEEVEVFLVFSLDRVIPSLRSRSSTIQFLVVVLVEVFTVYTQDRVQQRLLGKSLTIQFCVMRLMIFIKILFPQLVLPICRIRQIKGFFPPEKSAKIPRTQGSELGAQSSSRRHELSWCLVPLATTARTS